MRHFCRESQRALNLPGFSIIEIVVVLGVAVVLFGTVAVVANTPNEEKLLREEHGKIEEMAISARTMSVSYQQSFLIELKEGGASMTPLVNPNEELQNELSGEGLARNGTLAPLESLGWPRVASVDPDYDIYVRRWGQRDFVLLRGDRVERWIHEPNGLCEPISIQIVKDEGDNSLIRVYHPLTGLAEDEELTITGTK